MLILNHIFVQSPLTDIFSAGCIFYYVITGGYHPFGDSGDRKALASAHWNILQYKPKLNLKKVTRNFLGDVRLIQRMIAKDPNKRPPAKSILMHHIFWTKEKCLDFFAEISSSIKAFKHSPSQARFYNELKICMNRADKNYSQLLYYSKENKHNWHKLLSNDVKIQVQHGLHGPYENHSILNIPRAIRNFHEHFGEQMKCVKEAFGEPPNEYFTYWSNRFPFLVDNLWTNFEHVKEVANLVRFYCDTYDFDCYETDSDEEIVFTKFVQSRLKEMQFERRKCLGPSDWDSSYESD